jgi:hypothetical protein
MQGLLAPLTQTELYWYSRLAEITTPPPKGRRVYLAKERARHP